MGDLGGPPGPWVHPGAAWLLRACEERKEKETLQEGYPERLVFGILAVLHFSPTQLSTGIACAQERVLLLLVHCNVGLLSLLHTRA